MELNRDYREMLNILNAYKVSEDKRMRKDKVWVNKARSFQEAEKFNDEYYLNMTPEERLSIIQLCREEYHAKIKHENRKRFRRVFKIVQQK